MKVDNYRYVAKFYDLFLGGNYDSYGIILNRIFDKYFSLNKTVNVLDLGCGTGGILSHINYSSMVDGLDLSPDMLSVAKEKFPNNTFYNMSFTDINIDKKYNFIHSIFDSLNHVNDINNLYKVFLDVSNLLDNNGIFFFDFNTVNKFKTFNNDIYQVVNTEYDIISINREFIEPNIGIWNLEILSKLKDNNGLYKKNISRISEISIDLPVILFELEKVFSRVSLYNLNDLKSFNIDENINDFDSKDLYRVGFLCIK